jgi:hypothetical protein
MINAHKSLTLPTASPILPVASAVLVIATAWAWIQDPRLVRVW